MTSLVNSSMGLPLCKDICRLCLQDDDTLWNIFDAADCDGINLGLAEKVIACLDIMVVIDDGLPDLICAKCMTVVRSFFNFRKQCQSNDTSLRNCLLAIQSHDPHTEKATISFSPQSCPSGLNEPEGDTNKASFHCINEQDETPSFSLRLKETPKVLNSPNAPYLQQLENEWSDEDPSLMECALSGDTVSVIASPWRLGDVSGYVGNDSSTVAPKSSEESNTNVHSNESSLINSETTQQEEETIVYKTESSTTGAVCREDMFQKKSVLLTDHEENRAKQTTQDCNTSVQNYDANLSVAVTEEMLLGRISRNELGKWICNTCNKNYTTLRALKKHISVHYCGQYKCSECPAAFETEEALNLHKIKHSSRSLFLGHSCQHCFKTYRLKHLLELHVATEHALSNNRVTVPKKFREKCGKCVKIFYSSLEMETHDESCGSESILSEEESAGEGSTKLSSGQKECHLCSLNFENMPQLTYHLKKIHNEEPTFKCESCEKIFGAFSLLSDHRSKVHKVKHTCKYCQKLFTEKTKLRRHISSVHSNDRPFQCNICGDLFKTLGNLKSHHFSHNKPFQCGKCTKTFRSQSQLSSHENVVHLGIKDYMCERCGHTYSDKTRLKYHLTQSILYNLECEFCGKIFCIKQKFQRHMKIHHESTSLYVCNHCGTKFLSKRGLSSHISSEHPTP